jgi:hypothetical protein
MVNPGCVTSFDSESFKETRVSHELRLQNLDGNVSQDNFIVRSPNFTHTANSYAIN